VAEALALIEAQSSTFDPTTIETIQERISAQVSPNGKASNEVFDLTELQLGSVG